MGLGSGIAVSCGVGRRRGLDPALLWLWRRLAAPAPIRPLAWEPPCASGVALEKAKRQKKKKVFNEVLKVKDIMTFLFSLSAGLHILHMQHILIPISYILITQ